MAACAGTTAISVSGCVVNRGMRGTLVGLVTSCIGVHRDGALGVAVGEGCGVLRGEASASAETVVGEARRRSESAKYSEPRLYVAGGRARAIVSGFPGC